MEQCPDCPKQTKTKQGLYGHRRLAHGIKEPYSKNDLALLGKEVVALWEDVGRLAEESPGLVELIQESKEFLVNVLRLLASGKKLEINIVE